MDGTRSGWTINPLHPDTGPTPAQTQSSLAISEAVAPTSGSVITAASPSASADSPRSRNSPPAIIRQTLDTHSSLSDMMSSSRQSITTLVSDSSISPPTISADGVSAFIASPPNGYLRLPSVNYLSVLKYSHAESQPPNLDSLVNPLPRKALKRTLSKEKEQERNIIEYSALIPAVLSTGTPKHAPISADLNPNVDGRTVEMQPLSIVPAIPAAEMKSNNNNNNNNNNNINNNSNNTNPNSQSPHLHSSNLGVQHVVRPKSLLTGNFLNEYGSEPIHLKHATGSVASNHSALIAAGRHSTIESLTTTTKIPSPKRVESSHSLLPNEARLKGFEGEYADVTLNDLQNQQKNATNNNVSPSMKNTNSPHSGLIRVGPTATEDRTVTINFFPDLSSRTLNFRIHIFIIEALIHVFGPLSIPFMYYFLGPASVANHLILFNWKHPAVFLGNFFWLMWLTMNIIYIFGFTTVITISEVFLANALVLSRNLVIAIKYSYFTPAEYQSHCTRLWTQEEISSTLLGASWSVISKQKQNQELLSAVHRLGLDVDTEEFTFTGFIHNPQLLMDKLSDMNLEKSILLEWKQRIKYGEVPAKLLLLELVRDAVARHSVRETHMRVVDFLALLHCLLPLIYRAGHGQLPLGSSAFDIMVAICVFSLSFWNFRANIFFLLMGTADFNRRCFLMEHCSALLSRMHGGSGAPLRNPISLYLPLLDLTQSINISNWLDVRQVFRGFGLQYHKRVQGYCSLWMALTGCFILFFIIEAFLGSSIEMVSLVYALYDGGVLIITLVIMLLAARALNDQHVEHRRILVKKKALLQRTISLGEYSDEKDLKDLTASRDMVKMVSDVIDVEDALNPVRILGFEASTNFFAGMLSFALSLLAAAIRLFTKVDP